jgi:hypothetical protein
MESRIYPKAQATDRSWVSSGYRVVRRDTRKARRKSLSAPPSMSRQRQRTPRERTTRISRIHVPRKVFQPFTRCCYSRFRARGKPNCRRLESWDSARKKDCFALSGGNRFVRSLLTASSVIAVMPACMLMVPNPGSRSEWPAHCDRGIHYVWPCKFGVVRVVVSTIAAHILRKQNEAAKQHY